MSATRCDRCRKPLGDIMPIRIDGETYCSHRCSGIYDGTGGVAVLVLVALVALLFSIGAGAWLGDLMSVLR